MEMDLLPTEEATLPPQAAGETDKDKATKGAIQVAVLVPEFMDSEEKSKIVTDTSFDTTTSPATELVAAEIETVEAIPAEATGAAENLGDANMEMPADSTEKNAGVKITSETGDTAESESRVVEEPQSTEPTMQGLPATEEPAGDTIVTAEPEPPVHDLTPAEAETMHKPEEEDNDNVLQSARADADAEKPAQFFGDAATDGAAAAAASDATGGIQDHKEAPKDENAGEIVEALASKLAQGQAESYLTSTISDDANNKANSGGKVEESISEAADEPEIISHPDVTAPAGVGQDTVSSTENVQNDEAKICEGKKGVVEAPHSGEEKISETKAVQEKNDDESPSDDMPSITEVAVTPEVGQDTEIVKESGSVSQEPILASSTNVQNDEANPCEGQEDAAEAPNRIEEKISEVVQENNDDMSPSDEMACVTEVAITPKVGQDTEVVKESDSVNQEPIPAGYTNVQNDEANPCEGPEGVAEETNRIEEKTSEAKAVKEKNDDSSPSDGMSFIDKVAAIPEAVEQIKRRTLQGLLMDEKNTENLTTGAQPTNSIAGPHSTTAQEFDCNNSVEKTPDICKENIAADNSDLVVATTETTQVVEVDYSTITNEGGKESVLENANAVAEDTKQTKTVTAGGLGEGNLSKDISNEDGKQGEAHKADSTEAVKPQRHTNNIMSKVKQSIVKVKKVIIGKSTSSKTLTTTVEAGEINVK